MYTYCGTPSSASAAVLRSKSQNATASYKYGWTHNSDSFSHFGANGCRSLRPIDHHRNDGVPEHDGLTFSGARWYSSGNFSKSIRKPPEPQSLSFISDGTFSYDIPFLHFERTKECIGFYNDTCFRFIE